ncbi:MAG: hypothetical protein ACFFAD_11475 [Candidatus Hermodarchaeota archaeon]
MSPIRNISAKCPICKNQIMVEVDTELVENATNFPLSIVMQHGKPSHTMIVYIDGDYRIRGIEGHDVVLTEDSKHDALELALAERKSLNRFAEMPDLLDDLISIRGIEYADNKGVAIVSLSAPGPTIGILTSPSGRLKGRFVIKSEDKRLELTATLSSMLSALDGAAPLSPATIVPLLKVIEESIAINYDLDREIIKRIAESTSIAPITALKRNVFDVMCEHTLTDNYGANEIKFVSDKLDGKSSLLSLIRIVERQGFSILKLLVGLEILCRNDTLALSTRDDLSRQ